MKEPAASVESKISTIQSFIDWQKKAEIIEVKTSELHLGPAVRYDAEDAEIFKMIEEAGECFPLFTATEVDGDLFVATTAFACCALEPFADVQNHELFKPMVDDWVNHWDYLNSLIASPVVEYPIAVRDHGDKFPCEIHAPDFPSLIL